MIDFGTARQSVEELIETSLSSFAAEQPGVEWSSFALYACPWAGWIITCFDTAEKSARIVAEFESNGPGWYGEDAWGRFGNICPDFEFNQWRVLDLPHWQTEYEETDPIMVRDPDGRDHRIDSDEALNGLTCRFLSDVLQEKLKAMQGRPVFPRTRFRIGVQLHDSAFVEFRRSTDLGI